MKNFLVSLPKPSNIVAREPISSIEGLRAEVLMPQISELTSLLD